MPYNSKKPALFFAPYLLLIGFCLWGCANPVAPSGGPEDTQPPSVSESLPPNLTTNFEGKEIRLTFDEWVQVEDVFNQVVVSPPQDEAPKVKLKGKTVVLTFQDSLRDNTTYSIYFGESVKDITRNNPAKDLRFVFSTGPFIDSLLMRGTVVNAETGDREEGILVMLYKNASDSIVFKSKPDYFAKTSESGSFTVENINSGNYKVFALKDNNFNYLYDLDNEFIGFLPDLVTVTDSTQTQANLFLFQEKSSLKLLNTTGNSYGKVRFDFNLPSNNIKIKVLNDSGELAGLTEIFDKTALFWYDAPTRDSIDFELSSLGKVVDTITLKLPSRSVFLKIKTKIAVAKEEEIEKQNSGKANLGGGKATAVEKKATTLTVNPTRPFYINFNYPISSLDTSAFSLVDDSTGLAYKPKITKVEGFPRRLQIQEKWRETSYTLKITKGALSSVTPITNDDLTINLVAKKVEDYGNILTKIYGLDRNTNYIIDLLDAKDKVLESDFVTGLDSTRRDYIGLEQGSYKLRLVEDENKNNRWDPGNYLEKTMPERIILKPLPTLKPNWDVEGIIDIKKTAEKIQTGKNKGSQRK